MFTSSNQSCCRCRVSLDVWEIRTANWVYDKIEQAHCIAVIHSEGAYKKCELMVSLCLVFVYFMYYDNLIVLYTI